MSLRYKVAGVLGYNLLGKIFNMASLLVIIRLYGPDLAGYAAYTNAHAVFSFTVGFVFSAFNIGLVRHAGEVLHRTGKAPEQLYRAYFALQVWAFVILGGLALAVPGAMANLLFGDPIYGRALQFGLLAGMGNAIATWLMHILQTEERFGQFNQLNFWRQALTLPGILLLRYLEVGGFEVIMAVFALANLLPALLAVGLTGRFHLMKFWLTRPAELTGQLRIIKWLMFYYGAQTIYDQMGIFLLGHWSTAAEVARFGVLFRYFGAAMLLVVSLNAVFMPRFTQALLGDKGGQKDFFKQWVLYTAPGFIPLAVVLYFARPVWVLLNEETYADLYPAACILGLGVYWSFVLIPAFNALIAQDRYSSLLRYLAMCLALFVGIGYWVIPQYGAVGAALLTAALSNGLMYGLMALGAFRKRAGDMPPPSFSVPGEVA